MSEPFLAEIVMFGGNFNPRGWALCDGQLLPISQNTALFSLLGTTYGGDGRTTFALPDMRGRVPIHPGTGPGLSTYRLGEEGGAETVTLNANQIPSHQHGIQVNSGAGDASTPINNYLATAEDANRNALNIYHTAQNGNARPTQSAGGGQGHENRQPYVCVHFIIALQGIFPSRD